MTEETEKFRQLLEGSNRVLITSHVSPDADSISSILLLGNTLKLNYPKKQVVMTSEEVLKDLDWLEGYKSLASKPLESVLQNHSPDLIILVDAMNFGRCTRGDAMVVKNLVKSKKIPVAIIDHHEPTGKYPAEVYINQGSPATVQDVYEALFEHLKLQKTENYAQLTMLGIYSDTGGFVYLNNRYRQTLKIVGDLIETGVSIEVLKNRLNQYSQDQIKALGELAANVNHADNYSYSFIRDNFVKQWVNSGKETQNLHAAREVFGNQFIRNIDGRVWGFTLSLDPRAGDNYYAISFRSIAGSVDVSLIASKLGGGGHKPAAGAKIEAHNVEEAISKVEQVINS